MKTLTEFTGPTLKNASKTKADLLAAGKTPEELPQAMGEALKIEGDKLKFLMAALETVGDKFNDLKRVVVSAGAAEGETEKYHAEYFAPLASKNAKPERGGRDGGKGGRGRDGKG